MYVSGTIQSLLRRGRVRVVLENGHRLVAWPESVSGVILPVGSRVDLEVSPCNMTRARAVHRKAHRS